MANEVRLIDANALVEKLINNGWLKLDITDSAEMIAVEATIDEAPTIDPESLRPKGRWDTKDMHKCTNCGVVAISDEWQYLHTKFCPNCGAKMEG